MAQSITVEDVNKYSILLVEGTFYNKITNHKAILIFALIFVGVSFDILVSALHKLQKFHLFSTILPLITRNKSLISTPLLFLIT